MRNIFIALPLFFMTYFNDFLFAQQNLPPPVFVPVPFNDPQGRPTQGGQPMPPPLQMAPSAPQNSTKKTREKEEYGSIKGLKSYYGAFGLGFSSDQIERCDPAGADCSKPINDASFAMLYSYLFGWGPLRTEDFYFNLHYRYTQNWASTPDQAKVFTNNWMQTKASGDFIFPTKDLLRVHEIAADMRYVNSLMQTGLFSRLSWGRVGSSALGDKQILETSQTVVKSESFVPYASFKLNKVYRGTLSFPMKTEINVEDPRLSNATYSFSSKGRGFLLSGKYSNGLYVSYIDGLLNLDFSYMRIKYASIQNDRNRIGISTSFDFPIVWNLRAAPKATWYQEKFPVERVRIDSFKRGEDEKNTPASLIDRKDNFMAFGLYTYWDMTRNSRFDFNFVQESTTSNIPEFNVTQTAWQLGFTWSWPSSATVVKRVQRFSESNYAEEF